MQAKQWISELKVYEPGKPIEEVARELGFDDVADIIKVASNENELGPSPLAVEAMREAIPEMHRYPFKQVAILDINYFVTFGSELAVVSMLPFFFTETFGLDNSRNSE